jgi:hypothetical protein
VARLGPGDRPLGKIRALLAPQERVDNFRADNFRSDTIA